MCFVRGKEEEYKSKYNSRTMKKRKKTKPALALNKNKPLRKSTIELNFPDNDSPVQEAANKNQELAH
jgi:hypothetical protein